MGLPPIDDDHQHRQQSSRSPFSQPISRVFNEFHHTQFIIVSSFLFYNNQHNHKICTYRYISLVHNLFAYLLAFSTNSSAYATAAQGSTADSALGLVNELTKTVNTNKSNITGLKGDVATHSSSISTINTTIAGLRTDIDSISGGTLNWVVLE